MTAWTRRTLRGACALLLALCAAGLVATTVFAAPCPPGRFCEWFDLRPALDFGGALAAVLGLATSAIDARVLRWRLVRAPPRAWERVVAAAALALVAAPAMLVTWIAGTEGWPCGPVESWLAPQGHGGCAAWLWMTTPLVVVPAFAAAYALLGATRFEDASAPLGVGAALLAMGAPAAWPPFFVATFGRADRAYAPAYLALAVALVALGAWLAWRRRSPRAAPQSP